jgi:hypothetical protein
VPAAQVLHERVPGCDGPGGTVSFEAAHGSEPGFEPTMIGFDRVVRVLLDAVQRVRDKLIQDTRVAWLVWPRTPGPGTPTKSRKQTCVRPTRRPPSSPEITSRPCPPAA